jgi:hypothetical protein
MYCHVYLLTGAAVGAYAPPRAVDPARPLSGAQCPLGVVGSQMTNTSVTSPAAIVLRMGAPLGAPDAGDLCSS